MPADICRGRQRARSPALTSGFAEGRHDRLKSWLCVVPYRPITQRKHNLYVDRAIADGESSIESLSQRANIMTMRSPFTNHTREISWIITNRMNFPLNRFRRYDVVTLPQTSQSASLQSPLASVPGGMPKATDQAPQASASTADPTFGYQSGNFDMEYTRTNLG
jgi:hypothetical protein